MAATKWLTRTVKTNNVTALCLNTITAEPSNEVFNVPVSIKTEEKMLKYIREKFDTDEVKVVSIVEVKTTSVTRRMTEEKFIENSEVYIPASKSSNS